MVTIVACEFSCHIAHCFVTQGGSRNYRLKLTYKFIGGSLPHLGFSFLVMVIAFLIPTETYIFEIWVKVWAGAIVCIIFNCFLAFPVMLSLFGPQTAISQEGSKVDTDENYDKRKIDVVDFK